MRFNTGNKILEIKQYPDAKPDIIIESQDDTMSESFEIKSKQQLEEIICELIYLSSTEYWEKYEQPK